MRGPRSRPLSSSPPFALIGAGGALIVLPLWFSAVSSVGEPLRAGGLLGLAVALGVIALNYARGAGRGIVRTPVAFVRTPVALWANLLLLAATGATLPLCASLVGVLAPGGLVADGLLVLLWALALLPAISLAFRIIGGQPRGRRVALAAAAGALAAVVTGPALAAGLPPVVLTAVGAAALWPSARGALSQEPPASSFPAHEAFSVGALATLVPLTVPPLLAAFAGAVPQGAVLLGAATLLGWALGMALLPRRTPGWLGPVLVGVACIATLIALDRALDIAFLARGAAQPGVWAARTPWLVLAATAGTPAGLAIAAWRAGGAVRRPRWFALGLLAGLGVAAGLAGRGAADVPVRATAGLAAAAAMGLLIQPRRDDVRPGTVAGWLATVALIAGLVLWRPLSLAPAALDAAARVSLTDPGLITDLQEATPLQSSTDRAGVRCGVTTLGGTHLYRGARSHPPDRAAEMAETLTALLPVLATADAERAMIVEPGRGETLVVLSGAGLRDVVVLDRSPYAASQIAGLDDDRRAAVVDPALHFHRRRALPSLHAGGTHPEIVIVQLPPAWQLGSEAWYGPRLTRQAARAVDTAGWVAFLVPTHHLSPEDLAGTIGAFDGAFPGATIWLDPAGHGDLILLGSAAGERPAGERILLGLDRRGLRPVARSAGVLEGDDLLRRLFAATDGAAFASAARPIRGLSWRAAAARLEGREAIPLLAFADHAAPPEDLLDLSRVGKAALDEITGAGRHLERYWPVYLTFLDRIARREEVESLEWAQKLRGTSDDPTADLAPLVREIIDAGRASAERGMPADAEALFLLAEAFSPDDPEVHEELGRLAWAEDREDDALRRFEAALESDPERLVSLLGAADLHLQRGERDAAREYLLRATRAHPQSVDALHNLARLDLEEGRRDEARTRLQLAHDLDPSRERVLFSLAEVAFLDAVELRGLGEPYRERLEQARRGALRALDVERAPSTLCLFGQILLLGGNLVEAEQILTEAMEQVPGDFDTRAALGEVHLARHQYSAAARQFLEAERLRPGDIRVQQRLAQLRKLAPYAFEERPGANGVYSPAPDEVR